MRPRIFWLVLILLSAGTLLYAANSAGDAKGNTTTMRPPGRSTYVIHSMDELDISVWKQPDVSRKEEVRPDGKISLPLLNDVQAAGYTPMQLAARITQQLKKFVANPQVTVTVTQATSWRIFVLGEVNKPGPVQLFPHMTVLQALASAGGLTQYAKEKKIYVLRKKPGGEERLRFNYKRAARGLSAGNITLKPEDTIFVP